jgi:hypothetical protein
MLFKLLYDSLYPNLPITKGNSRDTVVEITEHIT